MRIATNTLYQNNIDTMNNQQSSMVDLSNQISTGKRVNTSADDPRAAAQAVRITQGQAKLDQYTTNLNTAKTTLQQQDGALSNVTTLVQQAQTLINQAGNQSLDQTARNTLATQLDSVREQLLTAGNTTDSQGNYLFGGLETGNAPFQSDHDGNGVYLGSPGQRNIQISDGRQIAIGDVGTRIFQSVSPGAARVGTAAPGNTGTAIYAAPATHDAHDPAYNDTFSVSFHQGKDGGLQYTVHDESTKQDVLKDAGYSEGVPIKFAGQSLTVSGTPAAGDKITVAAPQDSGMDVFGVLAKASQAIRASTPGSAGNAALANAMNMTSVKLANTLDNVLTVQASVGAREQETDTLSSQNANTGVQYQTQLSDLTGADFVSAYSQFTQTQTALQAAEKTFMQIQNMSLFDLIK